MNHYVNLLEPSECHYLSAAESSPIYKIVGALILAVVLGGLGLKYFSYKKTIAKGNAIEQWLEDNQEKSEEVMVRMKKADRVERAHQELKAWSTSRYPYGNMLNHLVINIPPPANQMQFTSLNLSETILGMNTLRQNPGQGENEYYPLERTLVLRVKGRVKSNRPDAVLDAFRTRLDSNPSTDLPIETLNLRLEQRSLMRNTNPDSESQNLTAFSAEFILTPRRLEP